MVVNADLAPAKAAEILLGHVGADTVKTACLLMVDAFHLETLMEVVPSSGFIGMNRGSLRYAGADK